MSRATSTQAAIDLKEAIREIHITAGFDEPGQSPTAGRAAIGITSPNIGDGKTTVAMALAASITSDFAVEVMLVDADLRTQSIGREYGLDDAAGLSELIAGTVSLEGVRHRIPAANMSVVTAGRPGPDPARLARSEQLVAVIDRFKASTQYVVIDLPAVLPSMTAPILAKRCDAVLVVVRAGETSRADLERTLELLEDAPVLGVVINGTRSRVPAWVQRALNLRG